MPQFPRVYCKSKLFGIVVAEPLQARYHFCRPNNIIKALKDDSYLETACCQNRSGTLRKQWWLRGLPCRPTSRAHPSSGSNSAPDQETACCNQEHCCGRTFYRLDALPVSQPIVSMHWKANIIDVNCGYYRWFMQCHVCDCAAIRKSSLAALALPGLLYVVSFSVYKFTFDHFQPIASAAAP